MEPQLLWHLQELLRRNSWLAEHQLRMERHIKGLESRLCTIEGQLQAVENTLLAVEGQLQKLDQRLSGLEERPTTQIDKIEYNFEQLKVDTLSGTLQIGLASGAEGLIEDLSAGTSVSQDVKLGASAQGEPYTRITGGVEEYLDSELYRDMNEAAAEAGKILDADPTLRESIAQDLKNQARERALVYMKELPTKDGPDEESVRAVVDRIRKDVRTGLMQYYGISRKG